MLEKITDGEIMTTWDAMKKYPTKYFAMLITEVVDIAGNKDLGYVLYTADSEIEMRDVPWDEFKGKRVARMMGGAAEPLGSDRIVHYGMDCMTENKRTLFQTFTSYSVFELKELLKNAAGRDEMLFYQRLLALKLGLAQEKVVGKELL